VVLEPGGAAPYRHSRPPFGGVKQSGFGRELADFGMREFVNIRTVVVSDRSSR